MMNLALTGYSVTYLIDFLGISRQGYYKRIKAQKESAVMVSDMENMVKKERGKKSRAGLRAIFYKNNLNGLVGINRFERQMSKLGYALRPYHSYIKTTDSRGHHNKFDNLIEGISVTGSNQVIVGDITYYRAASVLYYIFIFTDLYTLEIKGINASKNMLGINTEKCLRQVFAYNKQRKFNNNMIIHTDGGTQYRSNAFQAMLRKAGIIPSHARNCLENGLSERINGIVKNEYLNDYNIKSLPQLNKVLKQIANANNKQWPKEKLGWRTPVDFNHWTQSLPKEKRPAFIVKKVEQSK